MPIRLPFLLLAFIMVLSTAAQAADSAVAIMYHRFGEDKYPSTNIRLEQFEAHIRYLKDNDFNVLPLPEIVNALKTGTPLPDKAVAITVDDAYLSVYEAAWPRLKEAGFPFTLFVATQPVDAGLPTYMSWGQIRELRDAGVTIGSQTATHPHMPRLKPDANLGELKLAEKRFIAELGAAPDLIAYPYGEASRAVMATAREAGFRAGFGQHSGALTSDGDLFYLPRFAMNETYGDMERFRTAINSLPIPVRDVTPADPLLGPNPPPYGFTVEDGAGAMTGLTCYASHEGRVETMILGRRAEVRPKTPFPPGRGRINCTMPGPEGRWRWFGRQFVILRN